ncbi:cytochrome P450 [Amycolatopsis magusensis]|uniref:cytochrome P450 n=1 Tax=Amycolatopsis magusensis TaxID=882444 RepID=UPI0037A3F720
MTETQALTEFPRARSAECPFEPPPEFTEIRAAAPVPQLTCPAGIEARVVSRYEDVRAVLANQGASSRGAPSMHMMEHPNLNMSVVPGSILRMQGPEHRRLRRLLGPEFMPKRSESMRDYVRKVVDEHIDALLAGPKPADLVPDFAWPIPALIVGELLGLPEADRTLFYEHTGIMMSAATDQPTKDAADGRMWEYMETVVAAKQAEPGDDVLSRLIRRGEESGQPLTFTELVGIGTTLLIAGHDTTANSISMSALLMMVHRNQMEPLRTDPKLAGPAVEEMLRYLSVPQFGLLRYATEDISLGESTIKAGEWLVAALQSGNRDEQEFDDPDRFDVTRKPRPHLTFGFGEHQCPGQHLARTELQEVCLRLLERIPSLRLAIPFEDLVFKDEHYAFGVESLPVTWDDDTSA